MGAKSSSSAHGRPVPSKIEQRMVQALVDRVQRGQVRLKTFNSIILKFPRIDESFEAVKTVFEKFDRDGSGTIDLQELKNCFKELHVSFTDEEAQALYEESDLDGSQGIDFNEFIVLLALVYFLRTPSEDSPVSSEVVNHVYNPTTQAAIMNHLVWNGRFRYFEKFTLFVGWVLLDFSFKQEGRSRIGLPQLEASFETIVEAFVFFDSNGDGYISKNELIYAINQTSPGRHTDRIGVKRFEEMDWDHNGLVTFKEFLFAFTHWVGLEE